jgi:hypothetical protein
VVRSKDDSLFTNKTGVQAEGGTGGSGGTNGAAGGRGTVAFITLDPTADTTVDDTTADDLELELYRSWRWEPDAEETEPSVEDTFVYDAIRVMPDTVVVAGGGDAIVSATNFTIDAATWDMTIGSTNSFAASGNVNLTVDNATITNSAIDMGNSHDWTVNVQGTYTHTGGTLNAQMITINGAVDLTFDGNTHLSGQSIEIAAASLAVTSGTILSTDGRGHASETGPGAGTGSPYTAGGGGGHGGSGGNGGGGPAGGQANDPALMPNDSGSGGGNGRNTTGGAGGGRILVTTSGTVTLDGMLSASGNAAGNHNNGGTGGGGAGGTIRIKANTFAGSGLLKANGAAGGTDTASYYQNYGNGGGGGGGRIVVFMGSETFTATGDVRVEGGAGGTGFGPAGEDGQDGTLRFLDLNPVILLQGDALVAHEAGLVYVDPGATAFTSEGEEITGQVQVSGDLINVNIPGTYTIYYDVQDTAGQSAITVSRTVTVQDTVRPVVSLLGSATVAVPSSPNGNYIDPGAVANDSFDGDLSANLVVSGDTVNRSQVGTYTVLYDVKDAAGNEAETASRTVYVVVQPPLDPVVPVIVLMGDASVVHEAGFPYVDPGAAAFASGGEDLTAGLQVSGDAVNVNVPGTYTMNYNVQDAAGHWAMTVSRTVTVQDTLAPEILLVGDATLAVPTSPNGTYLDPGATASDILDGDLSAAVVVSGDIVKLAQVGMYTVLYDVVDAAGHAADTASRTVYVVIQPTLDPVDDMTSPAEEGEQTISLTGISASGVVSPLEITATSDKPELIANLEVIYSSPAQSGLLKVTPQPYAEGTATITVQATSGGADNNLKTTFDNGQTIITFEILVIPSYDYGDAPVPYPVSTPYFGEDGARHIPTGPRLGSERDEEISGTHSADARADDISGSDDEDGVLFGPITAGALDATATVNVQKSPGVARLDGWIDFNADGSWDGPHERIADSIAVLNGDNPITFDVPSWAPDGTTYARFRLSSSGGLAPGGLASDGEVEDYQVMIGPPPLINGIFGARQVISATADWARSVVAADVDGDGDMDVLSASHQDDTIAWYENDGGENFTTHVISASSNGAENVYAVDLDGDRDMDVLAASQHDNHLTWHENDGSQNFTTHIIDTESRAWDVHVGDLDGDGDLDVISSGSSNTFSWHENDGNENFTMHAVNNPSGDVRDIWPADIDKDGDLDLFTAATNGAVAWQENNGAGSFTERTIASHLQPEHDHTTGIFAIDVDGDGDIDALSSDINRAAIYWHENNGSQIFTQHTISNTAEGAYSVFAADTDGDGDVDVLSASSTDNRIAVYENDGNQNFTTYNVTTQAEGAWDVFTADVDGDGDLDVLSASYIDDTIAWYRHNAVPTLVDTPDITINEDDPSIAIVVSGISAGGSEQGPLTLAATSSNPHVLPDPVVAYTSPKSTATLLLTPATNAHGTATITVTVTDGGNDNDLATPSDNLSISHTFQFVVKPVNDPPVITLLGNATPVLEAIPTENYVDAGATAWDAEDGNISQDVEISGDVVDHGRPGFYDMHYDVSDSQGSAATQVTRSVTVRDTLPPVIALHLSGDVIHVSDNTATGLGGEANTDATQPVPSDNVPVGNAQKLATSLYWETELVQPDGTPVMSRQDWVGRFPAASGTAELPEATAWDRRDPAVDVTASTYRIDLDGNSQVTLETAIDFTQRSTYLLKYDARDASGNYAERAVFGLILDDRSPPMLNVAGGNLEMVEAASDWTLAKSTASDNIDGNLTSSIRYQVTNTTTGTVLGTDLTHAAAHTLFDTSVTGDFLITMTVSDQAGIYGHNNTNNLTTAHKAVRVQDTLSPVITLVGEANLALEATHDSEYLDLGATAFDLHDGILSHQVEVSGDLVNLSREGVYLIRYNAEDTAGNAAQTVTRTVTVQDTLPPVITLVGDEVLTFVVSPGDTYADLGATAYDSIDGDISPNVHVSGSVVDLSRIGIYTLYYDVQDAAGNAAETVTRTVQVTPGSDFGDAPSPYPVTLSEDGAHHMAFGPTLGTGRDTELDGTHSIDALADDNTASDDEDGVTFSSTMTGGANTTVTVNVQNAPGGAKLDAWVDFDANGHWDTVLERIADSLQVTDGDNTILFQIPTWAKEATTYARFRLSTTGGLMPIGPGADGEVEDYQVTITAAPQTLPGDYNLDGFVDAADYTVWRDYLGQTIDHPADGDDNGVVDQNDYAIWRNNFGNTLTGTTATNATQNQKPLAQTHSAGNAAPQATTPATSQATATLATATVIRAVVASQENPIEQPDTSPVPGLPVGAPSNNTTLRLSGTEANQLDAGGNTANRTRHEKELLLEYAQQLALQAALPKNDYELELLSRELDGKRDAATDAALELLGQRRNRTRLPVLGIADEPELF